MACQHCGAPIALAPDTPTICSFCGVQNDPPPKAIAVPVPVQIVHNVVQVMGAQGDEPHELRCPHCRKRLVTVVVEAVSLNGCSGCGGIWIDNASARGVLASPERIFDELAKRAGDNAKNRALRTQNHACPVCTAVLDSVRTHGVDVDVCGDHGTWFDAYELGALVRALRGETFKDEFHPGDGRSIVCAECHTRLTANRANISGAGLVCESCWRRTEAELIAAGDEKARAQGTLAVGGALLGVAALMLGAMASPKSS